MFSRHNPDAQLDWDATSLTAFMVCPRRYQYEVLQGYRRRGAGVHMAWGSALHQALELFDSALVRGAPHEVALLLALCWAADHTWRAPEALGDQRLDQELDPWATPTDTRKTRKTLLRAIVWYADDARGSMVFPLGFDDGAPAVEVSFRVPLPLRRGTEEAALCGYFDGLCAFGDGPDDPDADLFIRERKTTASTIGAFYVAGYSPHVQTDTYDLVGSLWFPDARIRGVLLEVIQTGVNFARTHRQPLYRTEEQRREWYRDLQRVIRAAWRCADTHHFPMNRAVCNLYGGCPYRRVCALSPSNRRAVLDADYERSFWDPTQER